MTKIKLHNPGFNGWAAVVVTVIIAEVMDTRTMSSAFRAAAPVSHILWGITTAHLFGILPQKADPFNYVAKVPVWRNQRRVV